MKLIGKKILSLFFQMIDFTLKMYEKYVEYIKDQYDIVLPFNSFMSLSCLKPLPRFCILRHDVDRKPENALKMAAIEKKHQVSATYYFRAKKHVMKKQIISQIYNLGHEIGYHYECLSDHRGDMQAALENFELNLKKIRAIAPVHTISMHGRPFSRFDNRDMWRDDHNHQLLIEKFGIKGEIYLDINYTDIAYISDTGRNWSSEVSNIRDRVVSDINPELKNQKALIDYLHNPHPRLVFLTHPERWHDDFIGYSVQFSKDRIINFMKKFL